MKSSNFTPFSNFSLTTAFIALAIFTAGVIVLLSSNERTGLTVESTPVFSSEIEVVGPEAVEVKEAGIAFAAKRELGKTAVKLFDKTANIGHQSSIAKVVQIEPENDSGLNAELTFYYEESMLQNKKEEDLILYSSTDDGKTWQAHPNSIVDPINNSIHLDGIEHFSLWTAGNKKSSPSSVKESLTLKSNSKDQLSAFSSATRTEYMLEESPSIQNSIVLTPQS